MPSHRTALRRLRDCPAYLSGYHQHQHAVRFEELVVQSFACLLHLPFYDADSDDSQISHRITWSGSGRSLTGARSGCPDGIARAHEFCIVIEATRKSGTTQWSQEFSQCLRHARDAAKQMNRRPQDVYTVLVVESIHEDTYAAVRAKNRDGGYLVVPVEVTVLASAVETSMLAFTLRHLEVRSLFNTILDDLKGSSDLGDYRNRTTSTLQSWQRKVLELEKPTIIALKSYETMLKIGRHHVAVGEILAHLLKQRGLKRYLGIIESEMRPETIADSLVSESLGSVLTRLPTGEELFCPVPLSDFKSRCARRQAAVEQANA